MLMALALIASGTPVQPLVDRLKRADLEVREVKAELKKRGLVVKRKGKGYEVYRLVKVEGK